MELKNVNIVDEAQHNARYYSSPPDLEIGKNGFYKFQPEYRSINAILKTLEKVPVRISSSSPITFVAREYLHPEIKDKSLIWMPFNENYMGKFAEPLRNIVKIEALDGKVKELDTGVIEKMLGNRAFQTGEIECRIDLEYIDLYKSASMNSYAGKKGFRRILSDNEI